MLPMKSRYAVKALVYLARHAVDGPVLIAAISQAEGIPRKFLEVILLELRNHGVLTSRRGKNGGYSLRLAPHEINLGDVIRALSGPLAPLPCLSKLRIIAVLSVPMSIPALCVCCLPRCTPRRCALSTPLRWTAWWQKSMDKVALPA